MTTREDWQFRVAYLRDYAAQLRTKAKEFEHSADELEKYAQLAARQIKEPVSSVDPTAGLNPDFDWGGDP